MCDKLREVLNPSLLKKINFVTYGLMCFGLILRFFTADSEYTGFNKTPTFLFICQFIITIVFILFLISGEIHKPAGLLLCFPLLMSRLGRGTIILMLSMPITNLLNFWCALIAIFCSIVGIINMSVGWHDAAVELKFAEEGVPDPELGGKPGGGNPDANARSKQYELPQSSEKKSAPAAQRPPPVASAPPAGAPPANAPPAGRDVVLEDPFMQDVAL